MNVVTVGVRPDGTLLGEDADAPGTFYVGTQRLAGHDEATYDVVPAEDGNSVEIAEAIGGAVVSNTRISRPAPDSRYAMTDEQWDAVRHPTPKKLFRQGLTEDGRDIAVEVKVPVIDWAPVGGP